MSWCKFLRLVREKCAVISVRSCGGNGKSRGWKLVMRGYSFIGAYQISPHSAKRS